MHVRPRWLDGIVVGSNAAVAGFLVLLVAGALTGRGPAILGDAGDATLPSIARAATHVPSVLAYLLVHTALYLVAGLVTVAVARLSDRVPEILAGVVLVAILFELAFVGFTTETQQLGRIDYTTWQAMIAAHLVADLVLVLGVIRVHPAIRRSLIAAFDD